MHAIEEEYLLLVMKAVPARSSIFSLLQELLQATKLCQYLALHIYYIH